ncbi:MAG: HAD family hydrolase, partial [Gammaproteobacteria bacterium]|nr:HAD family hydrolase [Gammaproteobacteria bacterium]
ELVVEPADGRRCRAVLFDVDGTLVNSIEGYRLAAERAVSPYGWTVSAEAVSRTMNFGESFWDLVLPPERRGDEALIARLRAATLGHWPDILAASVLVNPGIGALLAGLKEAGLRLGICTASRGESFRPLEQAGLLGLFDVVVTARDVRATKPDPEGLHLCLDRLGIPATEAAYVGDTVTDMRASHAAGLFAVGVLTGAGTSSLLSAAGAHRILAGLQDLPGLLGVSLPGTR